MKGYDWAGWSVLFYIFSTLFAVCSVMVPADYGLGPVAYKWLMLVLGAAMAVTGKIGASWVGKTDPGQTVNVQNLANKVVLPFVVLSALALGACKPPASIQTEPGQQRWYATQVLTRIQEVETVAIQLEAVKVLTTEQARFVVGWCVSSARILRSVPDDWAKTVYTGYLEMVAKLPQTALQNPSLQTALAVVSALLQSFVGVTP
jgi:hypothetical protein